MKFQLENILRLHYGVRKAGDWEVDWLGRIAMNYRGVIRLYVHLMHVTNTMAELYEKNL